MRTSSLPLFGYSALKLFCAGGLILSLLPALAQQGGGTHPAPPPQAPASPPPKAPPPPTSPPPTDFPSANNPWDQNELIQRSNNKLVSSVIAEGDNCFLPPLNGLFPSMVGIADLQVSAKAQREHKDGCAALRNSKQSRQRVTCARRSSSGRNIWLPGSCWAKCWKRSRKLTKLTVLVPNPWPLTPITYQLTFA
jgi:hypothetical protein